MTALLHTIGEFALVLAYCLFIASCIWTSATLIDRALARVRREQRGRSRWG